MKRINLLMACLTILLSTTVYSMENQPARRGQNNQPARDQGDDALPFANLDDRQFMRALRNQPAPVAPPVRRQFPQQLQQRTPLRQISHTEASSPASSRGTTPVGMVSIANDEPPRTPTPTLRVTPRTPTRVPPETTELVNRIMAAEAAGEITPEEALNRMRPLFRQGIPPRRADTQNRVPQDSNITTNN